MTTLAPTPTGLAKLFSPIRIGTLNLANRVVMAPMTRHFAPGGVVTPDVAAYYRRRAEADVGLIVTEGAWVEHPGASNDPNIPRFYGDDALAGWKMVLDEVHAAGGKIIPQLWHIGLYTAAPVAGIEKPLEPLRDDQVGPSGYSGTIGVMPTLQGRPMTQRDVDDVIEAFARGAKSAFDMGFDGIAIHGAHGYLIDQFFWDETNRREDGYGGDLAARTAFATEMVSEMRRRTAPDFPIMFRFSQWKLQNYGARLAQTPEALEAFLTPLADAGIDIFDCSQRRFWEPEFEGSDLNLAGWTKKLTGKPTSTVGSVGLDQDLMEALAGASGKPASIEKLFDRLDRDEFDLVGVGRALLVDPQWASKAKADRIDTALPYTPGALGKLY